MNLCCTAFGLLPLVCLSRRAFRVAPTIPEATLERALEGGCSLVVMEVLEVYAKDGMYYYKPRIVRTIIAGDLEKAEGHQPSRTCSRARHTARHSSRARATPCSSGGITPMNFPGPFAMMPWRWTLRMTMLSADWSRSPTASTRARQCTNSVGRDPGSKPLANSELPALPDEMASLCKQFREQPGRRTVFGRRIAESDLGSRIDDSNPLSSSRTYLPPKISLSRQQVLVLFGEPTWRNGWVYSWRCDDFAQAQEGGSEIGILSVTFDKRKWRYVSCLKCRRDPSGSGPPGRTTGSPSLTATRAA